MEKLKIHEVPEEIINKLPESEPELREYISMRDTDELSEVIKAAQEKFMEIMSDKDGESKEFKDKVELVRVVSIEELANRISSGNEEGIETDLSQSVSEGKISMEEMKLFKQLRDSGNDSESRKLLALWASRGAIDMEKLTK